MYQKASVSRARLRRYGLVLGCLGSLLLWNAPAAADTRLRCESVDNGTTRCPADTRDGVRLSRQLSRDDCEQGRSWGYDRHGIWVNDGCRAEFIVYDGRGGRGYDDDNRRRDDYRQDDYRDDYRRDPYRDDSRGGYDDRRSGRQTLLRCESQDRGYTRCRARIGSGGVRLVRQLSDKRCEYERSWGFDRDNIWVDKGCRAEFVIER